MYQVHDRNSPLDELDLKLPCDARHMAKHTTSLNPNRSCYLTFYREGHWGTGSYNFKIFFLMWTMFKVFIEFVTILFLFYVLVFWLQGMENLSSPSRDQTPTPCILRGTQPLDDQGSPSHNF